MKVSLNLLDDWGSSNVCQEKNPYGIKAFLLADASSSYIYNMDIYTGRNGNSTTNVAERTVNHLIDGIAYKGHCLEMDNYFCSVPLFKKLENLMIASSGTFRQNQKFIPDVIKNPSNMAKGDMKFMKCGNTLALVWIDSKLVRFLTNFDGGLSPVFQRAEDGTQIRVIKPNSIINYNQYKGGIDKSDQYEAYYSDSKRFIKWWKKVFMNLFETNIPNSFIIYREATNSTIPYLAERKDLIRGIYMMFRNDFPNQLINQIHLQHSLEKGASGNCRLSVQYKSSSKANGVSMSSMRFSRSS